jgi:aldose sugar dehydrogenase
VSSKPLIRIPTYKTFLSPLAILAVTAIVGAIFSSTITFSTYAQEEEEEGSEGEVDSEEQQQPSLPRLKDGSLGVELVADGLDKPTSMDYISNSDMIILQKDGEAVLVSTNGEASQNDDPPIVVDVPVNTTRERGFLGIAVADSSSANNTGSTKTFVFLYYTESSEGDSNIRNRIYRYEWDAENMMLTRPTLILDLPAEPGPNHNGGKLIVEKDGGNTGPQDSQDYYHLYAVIGDLNRNGILQNFKDGTPDPDGTSVVFRLTFDGAAPTDNSFSDSNVNGGVNNELSKYFAYGIRNSFGLTVDPLTDTLWMTENGPKKYDEINIVEQGFNSGWERVMGPIERNNNKNTDDLVQLDGSSHYADPVFSWLESVGITDIEFLDSTKLGSKYANNIFVGDFTSGNLYFFTVNESRTGITFENREDGAQNDQYSLMDLVADNQDELSAITFGTGFEGGITDIETGPDGYLYILTYNGQLYKIVHKVQYALENQLP